MRSIRELMLDVVIFFGLFAYDVAYKIRRICLKSFRLLQARLVHERVHKAEKERDEAIKAYHVLQEHYWRATNIIASMSNLQGIPGDTIKKSEFMSSWLEAWHKPLSSPPIVNLEEIKPSREIPDWELDEVAAKIDPGAYLDDSVVIGSVVARRNSARMKARQRLLATH